MVMRLTPNCPREGICAGGYWAGKRTPIGTYKRSLAPQIPPLSGSFTQIWETISSTHVRVPIASMYVYLLNMHQKATFEEEIKGKRGKYVVFDDANEKDN